MKNIFTNLVAIAFLTLGLFAVIQPQAAYADNATFYIGCTEGNPGRSVLSGNGGIFVYCSPANTLSPSITPLGSSTTHLVNSTVIKVIVSCDEGAPLIEAASSAKPRIKCEDGIIESVVNPSDEQICESTGGDWRSFVDAGVRRFDCDCSLNLSDGNGGCTTESVIGAGGDNGVEQALPSCSSAQAGGQASGDCSDSFTRCPIGSLDEKGHAITDERYGIPTSDGQCLSFDPENVPDLEDNPILIFMGKMITFISGLVGVVVTFILIIAGLRYTLARGNPQESAAAKGMIEKAIWSIVLYLFAFVLINWLIPGGLL